MGLADIKKRQRRALGQRLRSAREDAGFKTQEDFAHHIGANRVTVSRWESGASGVGPEYHETIKKALHVGDSFFGEDDDAEIENLRVMNRLLMDKVKALEAQLDGKPPSPPGGRNKIGKPLKRR